VLSVPPLHLGLGRADVTTFRILSLGVPSQTRPTRVSLPFPSGVLPTSLREAGPV
jgi:hypothetical protein